MGRTTRRRPTGARRTRLAAVALILAGGSLVAANVYASATEGGGTDAAGPTDRVKAATTVQCPDVGARLTDVPAAARASVDQELAALDGQIVEAYQRMSGDGSDDVLAALKEKRSQSLGRIADAIGAAGERPQGLDTLAPCTWSPPEQQNAQQQGQVQGQGGGGQGGNGPVATDYADITSVQPNSPAPDQSSFRSKGTFTTSCGVNEEGLFNSDNVIVAPGVSNGAHHFHDYVGIQSNSAFASDDDLARAETSCADQGDKSTYFWPVLRVQNGAQEQDADAPGGGIEGNAGEIVTAKQVTLTFVGNARGEVTAMPRLLRIITGDAKAFVNGPANANASWSCTGFEDRQLKDKYPLCPQGSDVVRTFRFQSCWDGRNTDSANHRTHVAFQGASGACPNGFVAIPQLVQRIVYDVDAPSLQDGGRTTPLFAVDSFPEQLHKPGTDHGDFINVFDEKLMNDLVACINTGRQCGTGTGDDGGNGNGGADNESGNGGNGNAGDDGDEGGGDPQTSTPTPPTPTPSAPVPSASPSPAPAKPVGDRPANDQPADDQPTLSSPKEPSVFVSASTSPSTPPASSEPSEAARVPASPQPSPSQPVGEDVPGAGARTEPQAVQGDLAETGTTLWPAAAGTALLIAGLVLLTRTTRRYPR
ncbi:DUF1996 domain-containing protein [Streptomyces sp. NPDC087294]|uniref:DUF1996 domain-containing protein n=1 Tax=Streptomyces sp. NPDC087294 TaxID=3365777 RepID=UPI0038111D7C